MKPIFDTHCHLNLDPLLREWKKIAIECEMNNIFLNIVGVDIKTSKIAIKMVKKKHDLYCSCGIHPENANNINIEKEIKKLEKLVNKNINFVKAIGECGLDYHYKNFNKQKQEQLFSMQIEIAFKYKLPLIIHCRDAFEDCFNILNKLKNNNKLPQHILIHCFDGTVEWVNKFNLLNCYYAFGGKITYSKCDYLKEAIKVVPKGKLLCETDSPFLSPEPYRFKVNYPQNITLVVKQIEELIGGDIKDDMFKNSLDFFNPH